MAILRKQPLDERIKEVCEEARAFVEARAHETRKGREGVPFGSVLNDITRGSECWCSVYLAIKKQDDNERAALEGAA
jgi:hypothetical protein